MRESGEKYSLTGDVAALAGVLLGLAGLAVVQTWPLAAHFFSAIPYEYEVAPSRGMMPLNPGDHLQFFYWCWLLVDNLFGPSAFLTNPYEFNTFLGPGLPGFANFPLSLLYAALYPFGPIPAYNGLVFLSYVLAGLFAYLLAREIWQNRLAAIPATFIFAFLPFRAAQALSGHLYGFAAFLLPAVFWCLERGIRRRSYVWGALAGLGLVAMARMEAHLIYYTCLLLGPYVILRFMLLGREDEPQTREKTRPAAFALWPALAGASVGLALIFRLHHKGLPPGQEIAAGFIGALAFCLLAWLVLAWLIRASTSLGPNEARRAAARGFAPLALAFLYGAQVWLDIPHLGAGLLAGLILWGAVKVLMPVIRAWRPPSWRMADLAPLWGLGAGLAGAVGYMLYIKSAAFDQSIAGQGRGIHEVLLFSPRLNDLWAGSVNQVERFIYPGWPLAILLLAAVALMILGRPAGAKRSALAAVWALLGLVAVLLSLGPTLEALPLYKLLYAHLPFFNFPRVPGRLMVVAVLPLALAGGWALGQLMNWLGCRPRTLLGMGLLTVVVVVGAFLPDFGKKATGLCLFPPQEDIARVVKENMSTGPAADQRILHLPIWPGDSHQSSVYEYYISRTRALTVNGYSPVVPRAYVDDIFWALEPLNFGWPTPRSLDTLARLDLGLLSFFDRQDIYTEKISPFPPELARRRLESSGLVEPLSQTGNVFLYRPHIQGPLRDAAGVTSPVTCLWEAFQLGRTTGRLVENPNASGWGGLFESTDDPLAPLGNRKFRFEGNVALAMAGQDPPGFLSFGPYRAFPPGRYLVRFRLWRGPGPIPGWADVCTDQGRLVLARTPLTPQALPPDGAWHDVNLWVKLDRVTPVEFRVHFDGASDLALDTALVNFAGREQPAPFYPAAQLWRQAGELTPDPGVEGGQAILARAGQTPPLYLMHGPQQTLPPGRYRADFRLAGEGPVEATGPAALLVVATDKGQVLLSKAQVAASDLTPDYRDIPVEFSLKRSCEVGFRVLYLGGASLRLAGAKLTKLE